METLEFPPSTETPLHVEQPTGELVVIHTGVAELDQTAIHLAALQHRLKGIAYPALNTGAGMQAALDDRRTLIDLRVGLSKMVEQANKKDRADTKARCEKREAGAETLTSAIKALEAPIDEQIKAEEHRKAEAKRIKDEAEAARKSQHVAGIAKIAGYVAQAAGKSSDKLAAGIAFVETIATHPDAFEEFSEEATQTKARTLLSLRHLHAAALRDEEDTRQREAQRVENARKAAELAEQARELAELRADIERKRAELEAARALQAQQLAQSAKQETPQQGANRDASAGQSHDAEGSASPTGRGEEVPSACGAAPVLSATGYTTDGDQHVVKAEPARADATDRSPAIASPSVGSMGAGQAADAAPAAGPITMIEPAAPASETLQPFNLSEWERRMGFPLKRIFIEEDLGIPHSHAENASVFWRGSDFARICAALVEHTEARAQA